MNRIQDYQPYDHQQVELAWDESKRRENARCREVWRTEMLPKIYARIERERREAWAQGFVASMGLCVAVLVLVAIARAW